MERLTDRGYKGRAFMKEPVENEEERTVEIIERLAAYEDAGLSHADIADLTARAEAAEADLRKCAPCWLCKKKCGIFDALDQRKDGCCPNFEWRGPEAGKDGNDAEK